MRISPHLPLPVSLAVFGASPAAPPQVPVLSRSLPSGQRLLCWNLEHLRTNMPWIIASSHAQNYLFDCVLRFVMKYICIYTRHHGISISLPAHLPVISVILIPISPYSLAPPRGDYTRERSIQANHDVMTKTAGSREHPGLLHLYLHWQ
jgi:hypothetical protein